MLTQYPPLTAEEVARKNDAATPLAERTRLYGRDLLATADAYAVAADAKGLLLRAARYLSAEATRLHREGQAALERADVLEAVAANEAQDQRARDAWDADQVLVDDLARQGLVVTSIARTQYRLVVMARAALGGAYVAVVDRGPAERDVAFARLMTKVTVR